MISSSGCLQLQPVVLQTESNAGFAVTGGLINEMVDFGSATCNGQVQFIEVQVRHARRLIAIASLIETYTGPAVLVTIGPSKR